ncbi:fumarylacetoacetase [Paraburkholderia phytofirmans]|jgi:fumarylacetoacetase|uniref:fumarylacetoacetase n=1 Tax=Paraburkholderia sp. BL9I2N2 TaxID=1938809 RepID=UPI001046EFB5|nr:fumarylacetoacetase [Paraburkholderia sp. BL9I2N2]TCK88148.1 fumarylacetoacetate hydrolase [Paraburkholderia sp. BL9I2N2]
MIVTIDETHDAAALSWVESANALETDFPLQNLPLGVFRTEANLMPRIGVRIGDAVLDVHRLLLADAIEVHSPEDDALRQNTLNAWMAMGRVSSSALRRKLFALLHSCTEGAVRETVSNCLVPASACTMMLPSQIGDFTDFYTSIYHARRAGELVRPDAPVHPNFRSMPIAYHGRASSVTVSGEPCRRPLGQTSATSGYRPTTKLDFELEVGFYVGGNTHAMKRLSVDSAEDHLFGLCLVNDWSARDIQRWESAPLGPFLAKSFMTSASPWVVTAEAIAPFRVAAPIRGDDAPPLAAQLTSASHTASAAIDISLRATLQSRSMRQAGIAGVDMANPNFKDQYWSVSQMLTHHASNGCPLRSGDLISSGTVSGPERADSGCLLERTRDGREPITLPTGEVRTYLEDGDTVSFSGRCRRAGFRTIGFGVCVAEVNGDL